MTVYSHSRLSTFENCPLQYRLKYIDRIKVEESETIEAFMGSRVHEALEKLYGDLRLLKTNTLEGLLSFYDENWQKSYSDDVRIIREGFSPENYRATGEKCIREYYARYYPFNDGKTLGLEQMIKIDIEGYKLQGFIDRLSSSGDRTYEIHDYKTSQRLPEQMHFETDRQLALYHIGVQDMFDDASHVSLVWHYLVYDKEIRSHRTQEDLSKLKSDIVALIERVEKAQDEYDFPAVESGLCNWCEYQSLCPKRMHIVKTGQMSLNKYLGDPGVKLVNEYAQKSRERKELIDKIDAELETLIKDAGKWELVSDLNVYSLTKVMSNWSPELIGKIKEFQKKEESCRIYLSNLKEGE